MNTGISEFLGRQETRVKYLGSVIRTDVIERVSTHNSKEFNQESPLRQTIHGKEKGRNLR